MSQEYVVSVEELHKKQEGDYSSHVELSEKEKEYFGGLAKAREELERSRSIHPDDEKTTHPKIQRVPAILRRVEQVNNFCSPRAISIGPLNRNCETSLPGNQVKDKLAAKFIENCRGNSSESLYLKIKKEITQLRPCFDEEEIKSYDDEELAFTLFSDGCSTLQFIDSCVNDELKSFKINNGQAALMQQDLFLLENQIPFRVLKLLMMSSNDSEKLKDSIRSFIRLNVMAPAKYSAKLAVDMETKEPVHLLDLLRSTLLQEKDHDHHHYHQNPHDNRQLKARTKSQKVYYKRSFRNIQDLKNAGIRFEPSETCSLRDVTFTSFCFAGYLTLPSLIVDDSTGRKLLNLVAYEMCPDMQADEGVTSYVYFLDSLIDNEEDAKDLRMANIFRNRLSSDADVAKIFNDIGTDLVPTLGYIDVKIKIQRHYDNKCMTWVAQVYRDHFSSPWTILALTAAVIVLVLTGVQTWFAVNPRS